MKRNCKLITIIFILIAMFTLALVGCTPEGGGENGGGGGNKNVVDLEKALASVQDTLLKTKIQSQMTDIYSIDSVYKIVLGDYKYTLTINANFDEKNPASSTIYVKLFDDEFNVNRLMTYYQDGTLYLDMLDEKSVFPLFGSSASFMMFYSAVRSMDISKLILSDDIISTIGNLVLLKPYINEKNIAERVVGETGKFYEFKDINLDTVKTEPNKLLKDFLSPFGDRLDALSEPLLGIKLSLISNVQIGTWNADRLAVASDKGVLTELGFGFSGVLDNREEYNFSGACKFGWVNRQIEMNKDDDPSFNNGISPPPVYKDGLLGKYAFTGTLSISGMVTAEYDLDFQLKTDDNQNLENKMALLLKSSGSASVAATSFYKNGVLYTDLGTIMDLVGNGFGLKEMGFPKVKTDKFNMSQTFGALIAQVESLLGSILIGGELDNKGKELLLSKITSDKNGYLNILVDKEIITYFAGGEKNVIQYLATTFGIDEKTAERYFASEIFDKITACVKVNLSTKHIVIVLNDGNADVVKLSLYPSTFDEAELDRDIASYEADFTNYSDFKVPEDIGAVVEGSLMVGQEADFSRFFGAFIGDAYGKNTPVILQSTSIQFKIEALEKFDTTYQIHAKIWRDTTTYLELWGMDEGGIPMLYIDYQMLGFKYKMPAEEVRRALSFALGEDNILVTGDLMQVLSKILAIASVRMEKEHIAFSILQSTPGQDPLYDILKIKGLTAEATAAIKYSFEGISFEPANKADYIIPTLETLPQKNFDSLYDAEWIEKVRIRDLDIEMYIPYDPDTVKIIDGKTVYVPSGKLFGKTISYYFTISGGVAGTKEVIGIKNDSIVIDPWAEVPLKDTIDVLFKDGDGVLPYVIEGFDSSRINPEGMDRTTFYVRFGTDKSILKKTLKIDIEVKIRTLHNTYQSENGLTVIGEDKTVNPLKFFENPYEILPSVVKIGFQDIRPGATLGATYEEEFNVVWDYDYVGNMTTVGSSVIARLVSLSKVGSGEVYALQKFGYRIVVQPKEFESIKVMTESGTNVYTVDVLSRATYAIPNKSTKNQEIRIYFTDGTYSTVGNEFVFEADTKRNSYLQYEIDWKYKEATNISQNGSAKPLGSTNMDTASYLLKMNYKGSDITIADFRLRLEVQEPAASLIREGGTTGVVGNAVDNSILSARERGNFDYHKINFGDGYGISFNFDPYDQKALPQNLTFMINTATKQGEYNEVEHIYPVKWSTAGNILSEGGMLLYPSAEDMLFCVSGIVGDGVVTLEFSAVLQNSKSVYRSVEYFRKSADGTEVQMNASAIRVSAYEPYLLPNLLKLTLENGTVVTIPEVQWNWTNNGQPVKTWSEANHKAYTTYLETGKGDFNILEYYNNPTQNDGIGFRFDNISQVYNIKVSVSTVGINIYENDISYAINLTEALNGNVRTPFGDISGETQIIDPYHADAAGLVALLTGTTQIAPVRFQEASEAIYLPVKWDTASLNAFLERLKAGTNSEPITLTGTVFDEITGMGQAVVGKYVIIDRSVSTDGGVRFQELQKLSSADATYSIRYQSDEKILLIDFLRPYALLTAGGKQSDPHTYLTALLNNVNLVFLSGQTGSYQTRLDFLGYSKDEFNARVLDFRNNVQNTEVGFRVFFSGQGSTEDQIVVNLRTSSDIIQETSVAKFLNRYKADGTKLYPDGYLLEETVAVTFSASGRIILPVNAWNVRKIPAGSSMVVGDNVKSIPVKEFDNFETKNYNIVADIGVWALVGEDLRNHVEIPHTYEIVAASVYEGVRYSGSSQYIHNGVQYQLDIENGMITFQSIFDFYGFLNAKSQFDKTKLPTVITPTNGGTYGQDNTFSVDWTMQQMPANMDLFYSEEGVLCAKTKVFGYGTTSQELSLYVRIARKDAVSVSKEGFDFSTDENGEIVLTIDPYHKENGYSMWQTTLPSVLDVTMRAEDGVTSVSKSTATYSLRGGTAINGKLLYDYAKFADTNSSTMLLDIILADGATMPLTVKLLNRTVQSVRFPYRTETGTGYSENALIIDPYDVSFAGLPTTALVNFGGGVEELLAIELTPVSTALTVGYSGTNSEYRFALYGYRYDKDNKPIRVEEPQLVDIFVIVLKRELTAAALATASTPLVIEDGVSAMLKDITAGKNLTEADFDSAAMKSSFPTEVAFPTDMALYVPTLTIWQHGAYASGGRLATDKDLTPGAVLTLSGALSDRVAGQQITLSVRIKVLNFDAIGQMDDNGNFVEMDVIFYDVFNAESIMKRYTIKFISYDPTDMAAPSEDYYLTFDTLSSGDFRHRIKWPESVKNSIGTSTDPGQSQVSDKFIYGNALKDVWFDGDTRTFGLMQIENLTVNFGYNTDTDGVAQKTVFVVDPLHPVFPTEATLTGIVNGIRVPLGVQNVSWNGHTPTGSMYYQTSQVRITTQSKYTRFTLDHYVEVVTLGRNEFSFTASNADITKMVHLDPAAASAYDTTKNEYVLPREVRVRFTNSDARPEVTKALQNYGQDFRFTSARWWLGKVDSGGIRQISIEGNEGNPWPMVLTSADVERLDGVGQFKISGLTQTEDKQVNPFHTQLTVKNRAVSRTNITGDKTGGIFTAQNQFALDPYNVANTLPKQIDLWLGGEMRTITNPKWKQTGEIRKEMIEGTAAQDKMFVTVELSVFGDKVNISFPVKSRSLGEQGILDGGTYYVDFSGGDRAAIAKQLPQYMFFNFGWKTGTTDYTAVPITFTASQIPTGANLAPGLAFTIEGTMGVSISGNANFRCTVIPVSPRYYALANVKEANGVLTEYKRMDYFYDKIPVPVNSSGNIVGSSAVKTALPQYLWLNDKTDPIRISAKDFVYNSDMTEALSLKLTATYSFRTSDNVNQHLAVNANGASNFEIFYNIPLEKYNSSTMLGRPEIDTSMAGADNFFHYGLGSPLAAMALPKANYGGSSYGIFYDFTNVNVNKSGDYSVAGRLIVSDEQVYNFNIGIYIDPVKLDTKDIYITADELKYTYTGAEKAFSVSLPTIVKDDGTRGTPSYYLSYAKDGTDDFIRQQYLDSGKYRVKVKIDDNNAVGERIFAFEIQKWRVSDIAWSAERSFEYQEGVQRTPTVLRLPSWVRRSLEYREIDSDGYGTSLAGAPINAGRYSVGLTIPQQDNCEAFGEALSSIEFNITKKSPLYKVANRMTYSGAFRHVPVEGLPSVLENGMSVSYHYYIDRSGNWVSIGSDMIRNAGRYLVEISVVGGKNYVSQSGVSGVFTVDKATLTVTVADVESYYLQSILPFTTGVRYSSPVGTDTLHNFTGLKLLSDVTGRSIPGRYAFTVAEGSLVYSHNGTVYDNYNIVYKGIETSAYIVKMNEGVKLVQNETELKSELAKLKEKDTVSYYLVEGHYGSVVLSANADVTFTGCYGADGQRAVSFDSITVTKGTLRLNLLKFTPKASAVSIRIAFTAGSVSVSNCEFASSGATMDIPLNSIAIYAERGYTGTLSATNTTFTGYSIAVDMEGGNLSLNDVTVMSCNYGAISQVGQVKIERSLFEGITAAAVIANGQGGAAFSVVGSRFKNNVVAVKYLRPLTAAELEELQLTGENVYQNNGRDVVRG